MKTDKEKPRIVVATRILPETHRILKFRAKEYKKKTGKRTTPSSLIAELVEREYRTAS